MRLFGTDLVLLHPPSVYDFRKMRSEYGPISDVIFSSPAYEMYPIGLTSIASHLEEHGHNVRIVNVAHRMVADPGYDAEAAIARLDLRSSESGCTGCPTPTERWSSRGSSSGIIRKLPSCSAGSPRPTFTRS
jgi:hypothetical protein